MKNKGASATEKMSCCDNCDCCKGDSCPMMKHKDGDKSSMKDDMNKDNTANDCSCSCCHHDKDAAKAGPEA
ncbi:MAG: hypothetical protein ABI878_02780 [Acidobacteriota bacterium]